MMTIIDPQAELGKLTMLRERTPEMTGAEREGSTARLAPYRDRSIFTSKFAGKGAWERHPDGDELVQIVEGYPSRSAPEWLQSSRRGHGTASSPPEE